MTYKIFLILWIKRGSLIAWQSQHILAANYQYSHFEHRPAQSPRVGFVLFLDEKNQKSSHTQGFSALWAFALQIRQNLGRGLLPPFVAQSCASGNIPNSPAAAPGPPLFYLLSPEDLRLTLGANIEHAAFSKPYCHPELVPLLSNPNHFNRQ